MAPASAFRRHRSGVMRVFVGCAFFGGIVGFGFSAAEVPAARLMGAGSPPVGAPLRREQAVHGRARAGVAGTGISGP